MKKRFVSIMLVMLMALSTFGTFVFAEEPAAAPENTDEVVLNADDTAEAAEEAAEEITEEAAEAEPAEEEALPVDEEAAPEESEDAVIEEEEPLAAAGDTLSVTAKRASSTSSDINVSWTVEDDVTPSKTTVEALKGGEVVKTVTVDPATSKKYTFKGLSKGTYQFHVVVKGKRKDSDKTETFEGTSGSVSIPGSITHFCTYSAYKRVVLEWDIPAKGEAPDSYDIYCDGKLVRTYELSKGKKPSSPFDRDYKYYAIIKHMDDADNFKNGKESKFEHTYYIEAKYGDEVIQSITRKDSIMLPYKIKLTFKENKKLNSHGGKKASHTFKVGDVVYATSYIRGQYHFYYKDSLYFVNYTRVKKPTATLNGKSGWNYGIREAQYFINTAGQTSMTSRMIFVNLYTQHLYILKGTKNTKGKWRVANTTYKGKKYRDWEISSGTASTPSPWGLGLKYKKKPVNIYTRERTVNGHTTRFWNFYHSETALHGKADNRGYGVPYSHGCIRSTDARAIFILNNIKLKTRVVIY